MLFEWVMELRSGAVHQECCLGDAGTLRTSGLSLKTSAFLTAKKGMERAVLSGSAQIGTIL